MNKKRIFNAVGMALCMSMCMSLVMSIINVGFVDYFLSVWLKSWGIGLLVSLPLTFFLPQLIQKIGTKLNL